MAQINIIDAIRLNPDKELKEIYKICRDEFLNWSIKKWDCSTEEAKDLFQESILAFYNNILTGQLTSLTSNIKTYIYAIAKNKMKELYRQQKRITNAKNDDLPNHDEECLKEELIKQMENAFKILGEPCRTILELFYYQEVSYSDIAIRLSYKNVDSIKTIKHRCIKQLKELVLKQYG